ncbi:MAG TPA: ATP-binding protein [Chryseolinea sp.]|nr:ATP-binding protein [Chryseolinea sp.]
MTKIAISALLFMLTLGFAQGMKITSSLNLELTQEIITLDSNDVHDLLQKSETYFFSKPDSCLFFAQQALDLARKLNLTKMEIFSLQVCGEAHRFFGDYPKSLDYQLQALELSQSSKLRQEEATSLGFIGYNYSELGEYRQALAYQFSANAIYDQFPNALSSAFNQSNIGNTYTGLGLLDSAFFFLEKAWAGAQAVEHQNLMVLTQRRLIKVKLEMGEYNEALKIYHSAIERARKADDRVNPSALNLLVAELYLKLHQQDSSLYYARLALADGKTTSQRQHVLQAANHIVNILRESSSADSIIYYQDIVLTMKDSLFGPKKFQQLQGLALREQQRKLDLVHEQGEFRNKSRMLGLSGILIFVLVIAFILYKNYRQKNKVNLILEKQKLNLEQTLNDLKATQTQLIQSEKMASLGELTAGIAHEIQNPLNFVNNFSEVNTELIDDATQEIGKGNISDVKAILKNIKDNEEKINQHGKRADAIVKAMLQHSRSSSRVKEPTNINSLVDEYVRLAYHGLRAIDKSFNVTLNTSFDEGLGTANVISQDIGRVILNVLNNAFYAAHEKAKQMGEGFEPLVAISTKHAGEKVLISVKDNGIGISEKVIDKIFQPFFTTKPTGQGTGLGLSLSYDIVKAHNGIIKINANQNEGAEFVIELPVG